MMGFCKKSAHQSLFPCVLGILLCSSLSVRAWWDKGHEIVVENAALKIPDDMPQFIKANIPALKHLSVQPDQWRNFGSELNRSGEPEHYIDLERITDDPHKLGFAEDRYAAIRSYFALNQTPRSIGLLPYQIIEYYQRLRGAFSQYRRNPSNPAIQQEIIQYAGILSHYAGDTSQPLHTTVHFDGRVDKEGRVIKNKGIHARFEGTFVDKHINGKDCLPFVQPPVVYANLYDAIREAIADSFERVNDVYQLEDTGKLETPDPAAKLFVQKRLAFGSQFLLNLWYTAWKESGKTVAGGS